MSNKWFIGLFLPNSYRFSLMLVGALFLGACSTAELAIDLAQKYKRENKETPVVVPSVVAAPHYKVGNPYKIGGVWYYPERDLTYDETGIASWYGDEFAGKLGRRPASPPPTATFATCSAPTRGGAGPAGERSAGAATRPSSRPSRGRRLRGDRELEAQQR